MRHLLRALAVAILALVTVLSPTAASAHDTLLEASPADGAVLGPDDPQVASFRFSNDVFPTAAFVSITDPAGADVSSGDVVVAGDTVTRDFTATTIGTYTASYRVTSSDGHPIEGGVTFTWDGPTAEPTVDPSDVPAEERGEAAAGSPDEDGPRDSSTVALIAVAIAVLVVGTAVALSASRRRRRNEGPSDPHDDVD